MATRNSAVPDGAASLPEGSIYHVLTECRSRRDFTAFGPVASIRDSVPTIEQKLSLMSPQALATFKDRKAEWISGAVLHINAPVGDGEHVLVRLHSEHNPAVAATLPGPSWVVRRHQLVDRPNTRIENFNIVGTYLTRYGALAAARFEVSKLPENERARRHEREIPGGDMVIQASTRDLSVGWAIEAFFETGEMARPGTNNVLSVERTARDAIVCKRCGIQDGVNGSTLKRCSSCKEVWYCGRDCQRGDWKAHKRACNANAQAATDAAA